MTSNQQPQQSTVKLSKPNPDPDIQTAAARYAAEAENRRKAFSELHSLSSEQKTKFQARVEAAISEKWKHTHREGSQARLMGCGATLLVFAGPILTAVPLANLLGLNPGPIDSATYLRFLWRAVFIIPLAAIILFLICIWLNRFSLRLLRVRLGNLILYSTCFVLGYMLYRLLVLPPANGASTLLSTFLWLYSALFSTIILAMLVISDESATPFFHLWPRIQPHNAESIIVTDLLDLLVAFEQAEEKFYEPKVRLRLVEQIAVAAENVRQQLPRTYTGDRSALLQFVQQKSQAISAGLEEYSQRILIPKQGDYEGLRKEIAESFVNALEGNWDGLPQKGLGELRSEHRRKLLSRVAVNLVTGLIPLGILWMVQSFGYSFTSPSLDYFKLFAFFWLTVSLFSIFDSDYDKRIVSVEKMFSIGRGIGKP